MFKKGDLIRLVGDEDNDVFIVLKVSIPTISSYTIQGSAKYSRDNTKLLVKPINNPIFPGEMVFLKSMCENLMAKKNVKPYSFLG